MRDPPPVDRMRECTTDAVVVEWCPARVEADVVGEAAGCPIDHGCLVDRETTQLGKELVDEIVLTGGPPHLCFLGRREQLERNFGDVPLVRRTSGERR